MDEDFAWTVEQACLNAWPSPRQAMVGDWLLRAAGGASRRINSVNPLRAARYDPAEAIERAAPLYAALGRPLVFRVPDLAHGLGGALDRAGFAADGAVRTLFRPLEDWSEKGDPAVVLADAPTPAWLALRDRLNGGDPEAARVLRAVVGALMLPRTFAGVPGPDGLAAVVLGVVDRGLLVVEAVGTDVAERGQGHATTLMVALMAWARRQGARGACLQVVADNGPARRLYDRLGFTTDLYGYHYRTRAV